MRERKSEGKIERKEGQNEDGWERGRDREEGRTE